MMSLLIRIFIPAGSWRERKFRSLLARIRNKRRYTLYNNRHNMQQQLYYAYSTTKQIVNKTQKVSILVPCYNTPAKYFEPLLGSVFAQGYTNWELVIVDASSDLKASQYIENRCLSDTRIRYIKISNRGIAANTNRAIEESSGDYAAFLDHDDTLDPNALADSMNLFDANPKLDLVYSDEDHISDDGSRFCEPHYKPDFSIDLLRNVNYITHFVIVRKSILNKIGGLREEYEGAQDFDMLLRIVDAGANIGHVPRILYHWRQAEKSTATNFSNKQRVTKAGCKALDEHYKRCGIKGVKAESIKDTPGFYRALYEPDHNDLNLSIVIDFSDSGLVNTEKEFILNEYRNNKDVIKYKIKVMESNKVNKNLQSPNTLLIKGAFIPAKHKTKLLPLFRLAEEKGVAGVSPKIVRHGKIFDMGIVTINGNNEYLFKGMDPTKQNCFGSFSWVRNVNELTGNVGIYCDTGKSKGRNIIWSHSEFIALKNLPMENNHTIDNLCFYSPNLSTHREIIERQDDYITNLIEINNND